MAGGCAFHRVWSMKLVMWCPRRTFREDKGSPPKCPRCSDGEETDAWHPRHGLPEQQALYRVLHPTRLEQPSEEVTPLVDLIPEGMPDARCLEVAPQSARTVLGRGGGRLSGDPNGELAHRGTTISVVGGPLPQ